MALIIEDGSIVSGANSLVTVQEYREYYSDIGIDTSGDDDTTVEELLIKGMRFLCSRYESRLKGYRVSEDQNFCVPRYVMYFYNEFLIDPDSIHENFKNAQIVSAYKSSTTSLSPDLEIGRQVKRQMDKVDVLETETEYTEGTQRLTQFTEIEELLKPFLVSNKSFRMYRG